MFAVGRDFKERPAGRAQAMYESGEWPVALAGNFHRLTVFGQLRAALHHAVPALRLKRHEPPWFEALHIFLPKHRFKLCARYLAPEPIHFVIRYRAELALHVLW